MYLSSLSKNNDRPRLSGSVFMFVHPWPDFYQDDVSRDQRTEFKVLSDRLVFHVSSTFAQNLCLCKQ